MRKIWKYLVSREAMYRIESPPSSNKWHKTLRVITKARTRKYRKLKIDLTLKRIYRRRVSPQNVNLMTYEKKKLIHYYENITFAFFWNANLFVAISRYIGNLFTVFFTVLYNQSTYIHVHTVIRNSGRTQKHKEKMFPICCKYRQVSSVYKIIFYVYLNIF